MRKILKLARKVFFCFMVAFVLPFLSFVVLNQVLYKEQKFDNGYSLCGVDVSNLTLDEAQARLNEFAHQKEDLLFVYKDKTWALSEKDFDTHSDIHILLDEMQKHNHKTTKEKNSLIKKIKAMGFDNKTSINYAYVGIDKKIEEIASEIYVSPTNAKATYNPSTKSFDITQDIDGQMLDKDSLYDDLSNLSSSVRTINLKTIPVKAHFNAQSLKSTLVLQSEFSTNYSGSKAERKNNIKLAVENLNNFVVMPNEEFSFNQALGKRTIEKGYKEANIIKDGKFVKGLGGGVCQVSTTLYNALLLSGLKVTESHQHTLPVSYVPPAMDAMVSWGSADLKFVNDTSYPVHIVALADGKKLTFKIYGLTKDKNVSIKTRSEILKTLPAKDNVIPDESGKYADKILYKGEYVRVKNAKDGYVAKSYLDKYVQGKLVDSTTLRCATYEPQNGIIYEGCDKLPEGMTLPKNNTYISLE